MLCVSCILHITGHESSINLQDYVYKAYFYNHYMYKNDVSARMKFKASKKEGEILNAIYNKACPYCHSKNVIQNHLGFSEIFEDIPKYKVKIINSEEDFKQVQSGLFIGTLKAVDFCCNSCSKEGVVVYDHESKQTRLFYQHSDLE